MKRIEQVKELRAKTVKDLISQIVAWQREIAKVYFDVTLGKTSMVKEIRRLKGNIARAQTVLNEKLHKLGAQL